MKRCTVSFLWQHTCPIVTPQRIRHSLSITQPYKNRWIFMGDLKLLCHFFCKLFFLIGLIEPISVVRRSIRSRVLPSSIHCSMVSSFVVNRTKWEEEAIFFRSLLFCVFSLIAFDIAHLAIKSGTFGAPNTA